MSSNGSRWMIPALGALLLAWAAPHAGRAQAPSGSSDATYEDIYDDEDQNGSEDRHAFGLGLGIVLPNENGGNDDGEIYLSANYRWRVFDRSHRRGDDDRTSGQGYNERHNRRHERGHYPGQASEGGIRGFVEPEIGYWQRDATAGGSKTSVSDLLVGINLIGVVPTRSADFFMGVGFGYHMIDGDVVTRSNAGQIVNRVDLKDNRIGANVQVGVELHLSQHTGIFGTGRLDILQDQPFDRQTKIWGGLRYHF